MDKSVCPDCQRVTEVALVFSAGDVVCMECGLVQEARYVDETPEWRTFSDSTGDDPARVGSISNPLLTTSGLSTTISQPSNGGGFKSDTIAQLGHRWQIVGGSNPDRALILAFREIADMADRLELVTKIKDSANEIYSKIYKSVRRRSQHAILVTCLYIACRKEDMPRTFKELCTVANGASMKEIGRAHWLILKQLEEEIGMAQTMGTIHAGDFLRRFCSHLQMSNQAVRAVTETVKRSEFLDIRKSPISVAAAVIYMISQLSGDKKAIKDISRVTQVAEATIRSSYKDLYPHAAKLIQDWFAREVDLESLHAPK